MEFGRLITAMVTPMHDDGRLDLAAAAALTDHLIATGSDSIVVAGTTGESPTLTTEEKLALFRAVRDAAAGRARVIAGTGNYNTQESIELTRAAEEIGVDGAMLVVPYYNNPPQEGLYRHFAAIAAQTSLPIVLYNVPTRTVRNMEAATTLRLAELPNIVAVKEASGNLEQIARIAAEAPPGFRVYSGDDAMTLPILAVGGYGVISVASHVAGRQIRAMIDAFVAGDVAEAARRHGELLPLFKACFVTTNPIPIKAALSLLGLPAGPVRLPLIDADESVRATLRAAMAKLGLL